MAQLAYIPIQRLVKLPQSLLRENNAFLQRLTFIYKEGKFSHNFVYSLRCRHREWYASELHVLYRGHDATYVYLVPRPTYSYPTVVNYLETHNTLPANIPYNLLETKLSYIGTSFFYSFF